MNSLVPITAPRVPELVAAAGERAALRFLEFFAADIRNRIRIGPTAGRRNGTSSVRSRAFSIARNVSDVPNLQMSVRWVRVAGGREAFARRNHFLPR